MPNTEKTPRTRNMTHLILCRPLGYTYKEKIHRYIQKFWFLEPKYCNFKMKGDRKKKKCGFKPGNKFGLGNEKLFKTKQEAEYVRPTMEEADLMEVDMVVHEAMASTSTAEDKKPQAMILRPQWKKPIYKSIRGRNRDSLR